jgi:hypothetical protein
MAEVVRRRARLGRLISTDFRFGCFIASCRDRDISGVILNFAHTSTIRHIAVQRKQLTNKCRRPKFAKWCDLGIKV